MRFHSTLKTAAAALSANKSRSFLTVLGIVIGITAIMLVVSIGEGAQGVIVGELGGLGAETVVVRPGKEPSGFDFADTLFADSLKKRELDAIRLKQNVPDLVDAAPMVLVTGSASYGREVFRPTMLGTSADFMIETLGLTIGRGIAYDEGDIAAKARVAIIGSRVAEELFGTEDPLGKNIVINGQKMRVIGLFAPRGQVVFFNVDQLVLIPYTTAQTYITGTNHFVEIIARASSPEAVDRVVYDVTATLRALHRIDKPEDDDFYVQTQQGLVAQVSTILNTFTLFLSFVVAIALVVGGVGVMNIMLVSVTERTREIGLRKALGATNKDIMQQFLVEAVFLTALGGAIGIVLGTGLAFIAALVVSKTAGFSIEFIFPYTAALLGLAVSVATGIGFGLYPARKASQKSPIEALRYE